MKLMVFGDVHGEIRRMYKMAETWEEQNDEKIGGIVQVGDFGIFPDGYSDWDYYWNGAKVAPKPTLVIMGNHEDPKVINEWLSRPHKVHHIDLLLDGRVKMFMGVKIGGIWGNYSPKSYLNPQRVFENRCSELNYKVAMHINRYSVETLLEHPGPMDMLITHDSAKSTFPPAFGPIDPIIGEILGLEGKEELTTARGCPGFDDLLTKFKPKYYFYGHMHESYKTTFGDTKVECLNAIQYSSTPYTVVEF